MIDKTLNEFLNDNAIILKPGDAMLISGFILNKCETAKNEQKHNDIITSVIAFSDSGIKESEIYNLLDKFWHVDRLTEATEYVNVGRHYEWPRIRLQRFLHKNGYDTMAIHKYMHEHDVLNKIKSNPDFCELSDEDLKATIENS